MGSSSLLLLLLLLSFLFLAALARRGSEKYLLGYGRSARFDLCQSHEFHRIHRSRFRRLVGRKSRRDVIVVTTRMFILASIIAISANTLRISVFHLAAADSYLRTETDDFETLLSRWIREGRVGKSGESGSLTILSFKHSSSRFTDRSDVPSAGVYSLFVLYQVLVAVANKRDSDFIRDSVERAAKR